MNSVRFGIWIPALSLKASCHVDRSIGVFPMRSGDISKFIDPSQTTPSSIKAQKQFHYLGLFLLFLGSGAFYSLGDVLASLGLRSILFTWGCLRSISAHVVRLHSGRHDKSAVSTGGVSASEQCITSINAAKEDPGLAGEP